MCVDGEYTTWAWGNELLMFLHSDDDSSEKLPSLRCPMPTTVECVAWGGMIIIMCSWMPSTPLIRSIPTYRAYPQHMDTVQIGYKWHIQSLSLANNNNVLFIRSAWKVLMDVENLLENTINIYELTSTWVWCQLQERNNNKSWTETSEGQIIQRIGLFALRRPIVWYLTIFCVPKIELKHLQIMTFPCALRNILFRLFFEFSYVRPAQYLFADYLI